MNWTDPAVKAEVRQLWVNEGLSAGQIALHYKKHNVTRNAVIGVVKRLGLCRPDAPQKTRPRVPVCRPRRILAGPMTPLEKVFAEPPPAAVAVSPQAKEIIPMRRVPFGALEDDQCRYADEESVGPDYLFCGCKREPGLPYCRAHCRVAFAPPFPRRPAGEKPAASMEKTPPI